MATASFSQSPASHAAGERAGPTAHSAPARTPLCSAERYIARRNAARAFLASKGMSPQRDNLDAELAKWHVPGWTLTFSDAELQSLAARYGWEG